MTLKIVMTSTISDDVDDSDDVDNSDKDDNNDSMFFHSTLSLLTFLYHLLTYCDRFKSQE